MTNPEPIRIQRKRTKGWKMPEGAVYVGRPTRFGNPFWHAQRYAGVDFSLRCFRMACSGIWDPTELKDMPDGPFHIACRDFRDWLRLFSDGPIEAIRRERRGKNLACWCPLCAKHKDGKPLAEPCSECSSCHADILLEIANGH
jgi:Domain of unknown function (DUF4326)